MRKTSYSLQIANGDLVASGSTLGLVSGTDKLTQDMTLWMTERFAGNRFHPWMGSNFQNYIGGVISYGTRSMVYNEAMRILDNYQKIQFAGLKAHPTNYSFAELLWTINAVNVSVNYDRVNVMVEVANGQQQATRVGITQGLGTP